MLWEKFSESGKMNIYYCLPDSYFASYISVNSGEIIKQASGFIMYIATFAWTVDFMGDFQGLQDRIIVLQHPKRWPFTC